MKKLLRYLKPYRKLAVLSPLLMIGEVGMDLLLPYFTMFLVNYGIRGFSTADPEYGNVIAHFLLGLFGFEGNRMATIFLFGGLMLVFTLIGGVFGTLCAWTTATAAQGFGKDLRRDAFGKVMALSVEQTDRFTTGSLVTRMTNDISMIVDFVDQILRHFVRAPMFLVGGVFALTALNLHFSGILLCVIPALLLVLIVVLVRAVPHFSVMQKKLDRVNSVVQENVSGARVVKAYVNEDYECERFRDASGTLRDENIHVGTLLSVMSPFLTILMNFAIAAVIWIGGSLVRQGEPGMDVGTIMAAITYITQVIFSVMMVTMMFQSVSRAMASAKRVREVLDTEPALTGGTITEGDLTGNTPAISFSGVSFRYPGMSGEPILREINLEVRRGETLAVIGATGSGKTSLVSLIPRFYDATEGEVRIDGVPIREYDLAALRAKIGFVMQKTVLFSDTISNNLRWGKPDATAEELLAAATDAQAANFVQSFAEGFETYVAEKGASLSGGQKQRLSIARAIVRKPEILILDDSTSALDLATEAKLQKSLRERFRDTTVIMVAQRTASIRNADRIAVIEADGRILHCAPHEELLRVSATYRDICASQTQKGGDAV